MKALTSNEAYNAVHDVIYNRTGLVVWAAFALLLILFFFISSAGLVRFLVTLLVFAAVVAIGLYYLGYYHPHMWTFSLFVQKALQILNP